jgi:hypothetical protein
MEDDRVNVPKKIIDMLTDRERKRPRGYPQQLDDDRLWNTRQHFRWLVETTWDEVGSFLSKVRTMSRLEEALKPWERRVEQEEHAVRALLWKGESPADSRLLYRQRKQSGQIHARYLEAYEALEKSWESLERFRVIPATQLTSAEQDVICDAIYERARALARAGTEYIALAQQEKDLDALIRDGEAYFARNEFLRFCKSKRYTLNPLNIANALAGLPFIGCRQSVRRCKKWPDDSGGLSYGIFQILERIISTNARRPDLVRDAERWLRARRPNGKAFAIADLREHWYYLRRSISSVLEQGTTRAQLAAAISREYWKRKSSPSAIDRAFADEEKIAI